MTAPSSRPLVRAAPTSARALSFVAAALLLVASVAGLVFGPRGLYADDPATAPAFLGQDAITLGVGLPLLLLSMRAARRGAVGGLLLWAGSLFYVAYSYAFYVLDPHVTALFPLYTAVVAASTYGLVALLVHVDADAVHASFTRTPRRLAGGYLAFMGAAFVALWGALFAARLGAGARPTTVEHVVWSLDFMFALPAMLAGGALLWRGRPWGTVLGGMMLLKATFVGFTLVVTTTIAAVGWGVAVDPTQTAMFATLSVVGVVVLLRFLRAARRTQ